jgi:hypothetical protein
VTTGYQIEITMTDDTVARLQKNGFTLYGFKAVRTAGSGVPVIWFQTTSFSLTTSVQWTASYQAYTSHSQITPGGQVTAVTSYDIGLDQVLAVSDPRGTGEVGPGGNPGGISILNETRTPFTCGIAQQLEDAYAPTCAIPLFGGFLDVIVPVEKVFLMFSPVSMDTGTVVERSSGPGILIDLTGVSGRTVGFDADNGWSWAGHAPWAKAFPPNQELAPLLTGQAAGELPAPKRRPPGPASPANHPHPSRRQTMSHDSGTPFEIDELAAAARGGGAYQCLKTKARDVYCSSYKVKNHDEGAAWVRDCMAHYGIQGSDLLGRPYLSEDQPDGAIVWP